ncbi:MAG TPA: RNA polymerase sigma factor [Iamia sp.]|jgi:RNA polymerase sigma-70 factor (ECF subfamily)|nr:RNA polymerase sigma factor [Iamia sp.]
MTAGEPTDAEVVARSLSEPEAFGAIFDRHADAVFGYFARRVPRGEVPDLVAETFRLAFDTRARFDPARVRARPWLYGLATNVLRHHLRRARRERAAHLRIVASPDAVTGAEDALAASLDAAAEWPAVAAALDTLADIDREAVLLLAWEELSYAEIAEATGVPVGTVRSRINRARRQVRELIDRTGQLPVDTNRRLPEEATDHG